MKIVLFQVIQFSISTQFSSIQPIDRTQSGATTLDLGAMAMKGYSAFPRALALLEPRHQGVTYQDTLCEGGLTPLHRRGRNVPLPQATGQLYH